MAMHLFTRDINKHVIPVCGYNPLLVRQGESAQFESLQDFCLDSFWRMCCVRIWERYCFDCLEITQMPWCDDMDACEHHQLEGSPAHSY